ncbi:pyrimidine 5-nucleotidase [Lentinula lateritia]|uniref:Pyrimidine 5-nucleotidase n=1 Tax=Lentinula aff. lateritia TaxID=2804960 RepID=A0ACC1UBK0_9AGAR|nr:pyrimidine 5-nucleotidase [Lentinula aff. lateritia]KAJ3856378.1 pyrimidine 5-nucleotidase [Lentinula lateritia]
MTVQGDPQSTLPTAVIDERQITVFFDIDNTLYSTSAKISQAMGVKIHDYFVKLGLSDEEASDLHHKYYTQYGLALADPLDFDRNCDQALPLEEMIFPNPVHRKLLKDIDRSRVRVWALTNAYKVHAERVLRILNLRDLVEGIVYCDYEAKDLTSKPEPAYYRKAMSLASVIDPSKCYFIDDNWRNVQAAQKIGWAHCVHFCERGLEHVEGGKVTKISSTAKVNVDSQQEEKADIKVISELEELRDVWPEIFKLS